MKDDFEPTIIGFLCRWCSYAGADLAGTSRLQYPPSMLPIRVMCSSRVDPVFIITAFLRGADAVLVAGCHPGDCHYIEGNYYTRRRFACLRKIFETLGMESDRIRLSWISASEGPRFAQVVTDYTDKIKKLGPNPAKKEIFL
ncbi:hydrogenase iron-sulfur subunit [candidate division WOR-3 bacterium]|nr:hydrogenase iron-sulfur subunit [candidate division WOR-3 bacterium]